MGRSKKRSLFEIEIDKARDITRGEGSPVYLAVNFLEKKSVKFHKPSDFEFEFGGNYIYTIIRNECRGHTKGYHFFRIEDVDKR